MPSCLLFLTLDLYGTAAARGNMSPFAWVFGAINQESSCFRKQSVSLLALVDSHLAKIDFQTMRLITGVYFNPFF